MLRGAMDTGVVAGASEEDFFILKQMDSLCVTEKIRDIDVRLMHSELYHKPSQALH
jgi:hypothetical protein